MYETLVYKKEAGLGIITLNQPNVLNALNAKAYEELYEVAELADQDDGIQVLIFHGAGRGFCAGDNITDGDLLKREPLWAPINIFWAYRESSTASSRSKTRHRGDPRRCLRRRAGACASL